MTVDLVVRNGTVVTATDTFEGGVAIADGIIVAVGRDSELPDAREVFDAGGNIITPGLIDPHVHFREPGLTYKEDFTTGSTAAAMGGVTCVLDMPNTMPTTSTGEVVRMREELIEQKSYIDIVLVGVIVQDNLDQIEPMADAGVVGYKVFLGTTIGNIPAPDDGVLVEAMGLVADTGLRIGFHAENDQILQHRIRQLQAAGRTDPLAHVESRPAICEAESIQRVALFSKYTGAKTHIFHLSSKDGMEMIADYKARGWDMTTETGPHYMFLSEDDMKELGPVLRMNPPVRSAEHGQALWEGILNGRVDFIATDHSPHTEEEKMNDNIWEAISGFLGVETVMAAMLSEGVHKRGMSLNHFVKICSENAARAWDIYPQKGALQVGSDGDITVIDLNKEITVDRHKLHSKNHVTPWHGWKLKGVPVATIVRGQVVMKDGELVAKQPGGKLIRPKVS
ncbi:MAG: allantoinase AllB [Anaerolineae bacterium]